MGDPVTIALRFALYVDLIMLFGLAMFGLYSLKGQERVSGAVFNFESILVWAALIGTLLSVAAMLQMAKVMSGVSNFSEIHHHILEMILTGTDVGLTWIVRVAALVLAAIAALLNRRAPTLSLLAVSALGAIALASLAWTGHGAMDEGILRYVHFTSDIAHLLGAGGWLGALVAFVLLLRSKKLEGEQHLRLLSRTLTGFETAGALIVISLTVTGIANYVLIIGPEIGGLVKSTYGFLLTIKVALFVAMLVLAAANRYHLSPLLDRSLQTGSYAPAINALQRSIILEFAVAIVIVSLVAWFGTLSPEMDMAVE
ncbi:copper homeostasis membrane protein CopD [Pseudomonas aeruginosa]|uniref:Copper resistance protein D n=1 Tax=Pseudomonas citronellolis TaxID=53408 RepID=A0AAW6P6W5_9PSED|nr:MULTISPECIES: copper homeostasis membrane protein CopD [Pseudomonas aeruginosa group]MBA5106239.1 copper homeostasis membrane protein CopD [Pseudomonas aeruginosa]MBD1300265.1 copper homeostasis membrane protein CopD [Pseudomonas aeruginosa]MBD1340754.1 copper homeostasis membrane protein CopD [Pseudomonas aeruginosa]MBG6487269.1 copper homeostasis membrane protein CopD [Pseudomonas aeruginosa]MBH3593006.1 copper homeostasis membrane protein CopD [Pseudomonas aeruginosa]